MVESPYLVKPGHKVNLSKMPTGEAGPFKDKEEAKGPTGENLAKLSKLQEVLYAQGKHALLVILQAMDAGGKDGAIKHVFSGVNPQGCSVTSFKAPSAEELAHDFLWRVHAHVPAKGMIGIFNRSQYEDVLAVRVRNIVPKSVWSRRYESINCFEKTLAEEGVTVLKFFLHISPAEQKQRLQKRIDNPKKRWKFNPGDLDDRNLWGKFTEAYEDVLEKCSTEYAPWYVVPADHKWFRNWVISDTIVRTMQGMGLEFPKPAEGIEGMVVEDV